jgi:hypothetical protein
VPAVLAVKGEVNAGWTADLGAVVEWGIQLELSHEQLERMMASPPPWTYTTAISPATARKFGLDLLSSAEAADWTAAIVDELQGQGVDGVTIALMVEGVKRRLAAAGRGDVDPRWTEEPG